MSWVHFLLRFRGRDSQAQNALGLVETELHHLEHAPQTTLELNVCSYGDKIAFTTG